jgi:uncharacterized protein YbjT (DUF2867 family)
MLKALVTGAKGNVGKALINWQLASKKEIELIAAVRHKVPELAGVEQRVFDFLDPSTFKSALSQCQILFLVRPPQISKAQVFEPLLQAAKNEKIQHVVFLSVQGAEDNSFIPHYKIEKLIEASGLSYTFLRPAYFMQNFLNQHFKEIVENKRVFAPAGEARFTLIDVADIAAVALIVLNKATLYNNTALTLTNGEQLTFKQMCAILIASIGKPVKFESPNLLRFFIYHKKRGMNTAFILVLIMLHYLPRFSKTPPTTKVVEKLCGRPPVSFADFAQQNKAAWLKA